MNRKIYSNLDMQGNSILNLPVAANGGSPVIKSTLDSKITDLQNGVIRVPQSGFNRQTVLSSSVDSSGLPNFLSAGSGLSLNISASASSPLIISFADGFDVYGNKDYLVNIAANSTLTNLPASSTRYVYAELNPSTGAVSFGHVAFFPSYDRTAPVSNSQPWFDLSVFKMKTWNGSAWVQVYRVFLGEFTTGSNSVTSIINYALRGTFFSQLISIATGAISTNHNLGVSPIGFLALYCSTAGNGYSLGDMVYFPQVVQGIGNYPPAPVAVDRLKIATSTVNGNFFIANKTSGAAVSVGSANFKIVFAANRGW